ncbi:hypothetical protein PVP01_0010330 [Plasmodium vivax]|uniref:Uncharacterized protein n=1 Tax=Plasmodium vivax TaxID=5855 RepID=A0A565A640_PLAVI|nr:hypothetical protein PVP01_0010330 [Plasmodium vivax]
MIGSEWPKISLVSVPIPPAVTIVLVKLTPSTLPDSLSRPRFMFSACSPFPASFTTVSSCRPCSPPAISTGDFTGCSSSLREFVHVNLDKTSTLSHHSRKSRYSGQLPSRLVQHSSL